MIRLYDYELSADCYKLRLMMSLLGVQHEVKAVDVYPGRENESPWFLNINPLGELPVLENDGLVLCGAHAGLVYLAARSEGGEAWYPRAEAATLGLIHMWLAFADDLGAAAGAARLHDSMFHECDVDACRSGAHRLFRILDEHLWFAEQENRDWICSRDHPTIADLACFPDIMLSEEGGVSRQDYPAIRRWADRFKRLPGFIVMSGIFPAAVNR